MKTLLILAASASALAGCEKCKPTFTPTQFVKHRLFDMEGVVIKQATYPNSDGMCLVSVRLKDGRLVSLAVEELEPRP